MKGRRKPARGVEMGEQAVEQREVRETTVTKRNEGERVVLLCFHSLSPALSAGHPPAQGGFFGSIRAAAQLLCVIGRLQESKEDT